MTDSPARPPSLGSGTDHCGAANFSTSGPTTGPGAATSSTNRPTTGPGTHASVTENSADALPGDTTLFDRLTDWLYRYRGETAVPFAIALLVAARPTPGRLLLGLPLVIAGEGLRLWAASHIGGHARGRRFRAPGRITSGPYALLRHPLYVGNALACAGLLIVARAAEPWFPLLVAVTFSIQYGLFIRREEAAFGSQSREAALAGQRTVGSVPLAGQQPHPAPPRYRPWLTRQGFDLEWPTLRTIMALLLALLGLAWIRNP